MYLTFAEYQTIGGTLNETAYNKYSFRATSIIDNATHERIKAMLVVPDAVLYLERDVIECLNDNDNNISSKSQSVGGVSESESYKAPTEEEKDKKINDLIIDYLSLIIDDNGTSLLYRGAI